MSIRPKITIAIRTNNEAKDLEKVLPLIYSQKKVQRPEVILIDSFSKDGTQELIKKYNLGAVYIEQKNFTHAWTFNLCTKYAQGEIVVFISAHCLPTDKYWLYNLTKHFSDKKVGGVFGAQIPIKDLNYIDEFKTNEMFPLKKGRVTGVKFSNANGVIRRNLLLKHPYDEKVYVQYMGGEDQKIIDAIKEEGHKIIYEPLSQVYHLHPYSFKNKIKNAFQQGYYYPEYAKWDKGIYMLGYRKSDLIRYLLEKKAYKEIIFNCVIHGIIIRVYNLFGKIKRKIDQRLFGKEFIPFYKIQKKEVSLKYK